MSQPATLGLHLRVRGVLYIRRAIQIDVFTFFLSCMVWILVLGWMSVCLQASVSHTWADTWRETSMTCRSGVVMQYSSGISSIARIPLLSVRFFSQMQTLLRLFFYALVCFYASSKHNVVRRIVNPGCIHVSCSWNIVNANAISWKVLVGLIPNLQRWCIVERT